MNPLIENRVKKLGKKAPRHFNDYLCLICGKDFKHSDCPHSYGDQETAITAYETKEMLK